MSHSQHGEHLQAQKPSMNRQTIKRATADRVYAHIITAMTAVEMKAGHFVDAFLFCSTTKQLTFCYFQKENLKGSAVKANKTCSSCSPQRAQSWFPI